jgi:hypothetical protein
MKNTQLCIFILFIFSAYILCAQISYLNFQPVIDLNDLLTMRPDIKYQQLSDSCMVSCMPNYELLEDKMWWESYPVEFPKRFVLEIPNGSVYAQHGSIIVNNMYINEFIWAPTKAERIFPLANIINLPQPEFVHGTIAVLAQGGCGNYYHWMLELLPRFAILEESKIHYDYIYTQVRFDFMKESLTLLGVDLNGVIPANKDRYIQADRLVVPSVASPFGYATPFAIDFLRTKFIPLAQKTIDSSNFSKRVFISRNKNSIRRIKNEEEVFKLFEPYGFVKYELENLSILEQVALFYHAEIIVGEHGAGLANIVFCQPETQVVEIFQARYDAMYWYLSQQVGLRYTFVKTTDFGIDNGKRSQVIIPLEPIKKCIKKLFN